MKNPDQSPPPIPDNAPSVAFDINLGKKYQNVAFDYETFNQEADRLGLSDEARSEMTINVIGKSMFRSGVWKRKSKQMKITAGPKVNKTLAHEMRHAAESEEEVKRNRPWKVTRAVGAASLITQAELILTAPLHPVTNLLGEQAGEAVTEALTKGMPLAAGLSAIATVGGYYLSPAERNARQAANESNAAVISLDRK